MAQVGLVAMIVAIAGRLRVAWACDVLGHSCVEGVCHVQHAGMPHACAGVSGLSSVVDIFSATAGTWSTAALSAIRSWLVAASLPNQGLAMFAGGTGTSFYNYCSEFQ